MNRNFKLTGFLVAAILLLAGCQGALQRGMLDNTYISTARPAISLGVPGMPLMVAGQGITNMTWTGMAGGLPIQVWTAVYGAGGLSPLAIVAQAQTPEGWYWDSPQALPFSVDQGTTAFNGVTYQAFTHIINPANDAFSNLYTAVQPDGAPQYWVARTYMARFNFNDDKIILQYREPLPQGITSLTEIPYGQAAFLPEFTERAHNAFQVGNCPENVSGVTEGFANSIRWQFMNQNFLGTVSKNISLYWP